MSTQQLDPTHAETLSAAAAAIDVRHEAALLKTGALQDAILNSANFSSIATDEKGVIQLFNVGAERMLGYTALEVIDKITPAAISDPQELVARAEALSIELATPIEPGFEHSSSKPRAASKTSTNSPTSARMGAAFLPSYRLPPCAMHKAESSAIF